MRENGGLITRADFESYRARWREPVRGRYRDCEIVSFPPPSSGGVHVIEILNLLERFDLKSLGDSSPAFVHLVAEAMKLAFADRARWLGDPDFVRVPRGLISKEYAAALSASIRPERVTPVIRAGMPPRAESDVFAGEQQRHTTHLSAADAEGYWVGLTATINTSFGSKVTVPGTGILLNNEMDDFAAQPGAPNFFGLVGSEANAVEGGKRPLSSMSPTIVLRNGLPILCVGAAGGPTIISQTVLAILRTVDFGLPVGEALAQPRFHHQWRPDELQVERSLGPEVVEALRRMGHRVVEVPSLGAAQAVGSAPAGLGLTGAADPRSEGSAEGR
jgi:gamma-glutamyltranspeptidase/glutathione hydrolase